MRSDIITPLRASMPEGVHTEVRMQRSRNARVTYLGGNDRDVPKWNLVIIYIIFAIMMIFGIIRNIGAFNLNI